MPTKLDSTDLRILEGLGVYSPRNVNRVARELNLPIEKVRRRIKRMKSLGLLWLHADIYHTNLGLKKALVIAEAALGYENLLFDCMKANDFWIFVTRCHGKSEGCLGVYTIPVEHCNLFEQFCAKLREFGAARSTQIFWSTCFHKVNPKVSWFDFRRQESVFPWDEWVREMPAEGTELPSTLLEPKDFVVLGDYEDVFILKEMEKDATVSLSRIGRMLGISPQAVKHHYDEHVVERGLLEGFEVEAFPYDKAISDFYFFVFSFPDTDKLSKFASSLLDKPFVDMLGRVLVQPKLICKLFLPKPEFRNFKDSLSTLIRAGYLQGYDYVVQYPHGWCRQTISYEFFKNQRWVYNHKRHVQAVRQLVAKQPPLTKSAVA